MTFKAETDGRFAKSRSGEVFYGSFQPSMKPLALQLYAKQVQLLIVFLTSLLDISCFTRTSVASEFKRTCESELWFSYVEVEPILTQITY